MKDEIKEILEELEEKNETYKECGENGIIENEYYKSHILLDYITNLQEEIRRLKELCDKYEEEHRTTFEYWKQLVKEDYKSRCEKAIEYILKLDKDYDINVYQEDKHWAMVLYILQGEDKDE